MTFAQVAGTNESTQTTAVTTHLVALPPNRVIGETLVIYFAYNSGTGAGGITFPADWIRFREPDDNGTNAGLAYVYKVCDGTETSTVTVLTGTAQKSAHYSQRISGARAGARPVVAGLFVGATTLNPNPPSLNLFDSEDLLFQVVVAYDLSTDANIVVSAYPANYSNGVNVRVATTDGVGLGVARRELAAAGDDPGTFTLSASEQTITNLIAFRPAIVADPITVASGNNLVSGLAEALGNDVPGLSYSLTGGNVFEDHLPPEPDIAVAVYSTGGGEAGALLAYDSPTIQIVVRGEADPETTQDLWYAIYSYVHALRYVTLPNGVFLVYSIVMQSAPVPIGADESGRYRYTMNLRCETINATDHRP